MRPHEQLSVDSLLLLLLSTSPGDAAVVRLFTSAFAFCCVSLIAACLLVAAVAVCVRLVCSITPFLRLSRASIQQQTSQSHPFCIDPIDELASLQLQTLCARFDPVWHSSSSSRHVRSRSLSQLAACAAGVARYRVRMISIETC